MPTPSLLRWAAVSALILSGPRTPAQFTISEFLADNASGLRDADGDTPDWLELENSGTILASTNGWFLTDDPTDLRKWPLPDVTVNAGARLVVFCSGKDRRIPTAELHASFSLDAAGEFLALVKPDGSTIASGFSPAFPRQRPDVSYGIGRRVTDDFLIRPSSMAKWKIPGAGDAGTAWTNPSFDDSAWTALQAAVGWQTAPGGPAAQAYWSFDQGPTDAVAGVNATLNGPAYNPAFPAAIGSGQSLTFSSTDGDYVSALLNVSETAYTSSFWFRTTNPNAGLMAVTDGELGSGGSDRHVFLAAGNIRARTWSNETIGSSGKAYANGQWHHVAHVFGGSQGGQKIFVNGQLVASGSKAASDFNWQQRIQLGFSNDAGSQYLTGEIDDVGFFAAALTTPQIQTLAAGTSPLALSGVTPYVRSNTQTGMAGQSSAGFLRIPFQISRNPATWEQLSLRVRYGDGFALWINGTLVTQRNTPPNPDGSAKANTDRPLADTVRVESIDLTPHLPLLRQGSNVAAILALTHQANAADFLLEPELAASDIEENTAQFMTTPTPGTTNAEGSAGFIDDLTFSTRRGWFTQPFSTTIRCTTPDATIVYTTDGSAPTLTNGTKVNPASQGGTPDATVSIQTSTILRASAFRPGWISSPPDTQSYFFASRVRTQSASQPGLPTTWSGGVAADYGVDPNIVNSTRPGYSLEDALAALPTLSIAASPSDLFGNPNGVYYNTGQRGIGSEKIVSAEFFDPSGASASWQVEAGLRSHGNSSRDHGFTPKHPLRLYFRRTYGDAKLNAEVFPDSPIREFNRLLLRAASTDSWPVVDGPPRWVNEKATYMRDAYMRRSMRDLGHPAGHSRYVQLFLNGLYWGMYEITERPEEDFAAAYLGGSPDDYDVIKDFAELASGNLTSWNQLMSLANSGTALTNDAGYWLVQGRNPDGSPHATAEPLLHMASFIDYMILHISGGAEDWPNHNYWAFRRRGPLSDGFHFIPWDQEISNDNTTRTGSHIFPNIFEQVNAANSPAIVYDRLRRGPAFRQRFRDRVHELYFNNGPLSQPASRARWASLQNVIDKAIVGESARWGDRQQTPAFKRETTWLAEMNFMQAPNTGFWDVMWPKQVQRFRSVGLYPNLSQPSFSLPPGPTVPGSLLSLSSTTGTVYYTLDGSDPRSPGGQPSASATAFLSGSTTTALIPPQSLWKYLVTPTEPNPAWKSLDFPDNTWPSGHGQLGYGDGDEATVIGFGPSTTNRYMTTYFRRDFTLPDGAAPSTARLRLLRDDGAVVYLNGQEVWRTNLNPTAPITWSTPSSTVAGGADESSFYYETLLNPVLLRPGRNTIAVEVHNASPSDDDLSFDLALEITAPLSNPAIVLDQSRTVRARTFLNGEWSGMNSAFYQVNSVPPSPANLVVSRIHYHPAEPATPAETAVSTNRDDFEFIELLNVGPQTIDLPGLAFTEGIAFSFTSSAPFTQLAPGARVIVARRAAALTARYGPGLPIAGEFAGNTGLSNSGETITLATPTATIRQFAYDDALPWPSAADGGGPELVLTAPSPAAASDPWHSNGLHWHAASTTNPGSPPSPTFSQWLATNPHPDDPDGDGRNALAEYAMGSLPLVPDSSPILSANASQAGTELTLTRAIGPQVAFRIESSPNLSHWSPLPDSPIARSTAGNLESITFLIPHSPNHSVVRAVVSLP
ncbi:MAG: CotH kinase family protein [Verrucomicrobiota bacterium]